MLINKLLTVNERYPVLYITGIMLRFSFVVAIMTITALANVVTSDRFGLWTPGDRADQNRCDPLLPTAALFNLKLIHQAAARRG